MDLRVPTFNWLCEVFDHWEQIKFIQKIGTLSLSYSAALGVDFQKMSHAIQSLQISLIS